MGRIVDLSVTIGPDTLSPPSMRRRVVLTTFHRSPGYWQSTLVDMSLHTGSHVDFARHVLENGETAAHVSLDRLCGRARVVDMTDVGPDAAITAAAIQERAGHFEAGDIAVVRTDWAERMWGTFPDYYIHSPFCEPAAAQWLIDRGVKAIAFDCFSEYCARLPDFTPDDFVIHKIILEHDALLMQHLTNLSQLPTDRDFQFYAAPIKLADAEGSPARFFAVVDDH
jgi:kynurenine formamidase